MGLGKDAYFEHLEQKNDEKIAKILGITSEELSETEWQIETDASKDGLIYGYVIYFEEDNSPKEILDKIKGLDSDYQVWLQPYEFEDEEFYDYEDEYDAIITNKFFYDSFQQEISNIEKLNNLELEDNVLLKVLKRQLFISAIGVLETFLSETFINLNNENQEYFENFIQTFPNFKERKFQLNEIYTEYDKLRDTANKEMLKVIYHNLSIVRKMFIATFKIEFPDISELAKAVNTRHDLVHRNGKTKNNQEVFVEKETVTNLLKHISSFVEDISNSLNLKKV